ncbi:MAG: DMT family transporter [Roseovarius sp.]|nr:DMT family transporter [Roseovarius sp.]
METWIILSIGAAAFQTLRFMLQKYLSMGALSAGGATLARFVFSAPFVVMLAIGYLAVAGTAWPGYPPPFWGYAIAGGLAQILGTWAIVMLFAERNFAVGIAFKKTEVVQTALLGLVVLGDRLPLAGVGAILLGLVGVLLLSQTPGRAGRWWRRIAPRPAFLGLASGACFAVSAVGYRGATLQIASDDPLLRAVLTLAVVTVMQSVTLSLWLHLREPGQLIRVATAWRTAVWIGLAGLGGSLCGFTAFTLQNAALVFAVGQVEVVFSLIAAWLFFGERLSAREGWGIALVTLSVIAVVALR